MNEDTIPEHTPEDVEDMRATIREIAVLSPEEKRALEKVQKKRAKRDMKLLIRAIMDSPLRKGETIEVDGDVPIEVLARQNTDVQTRMLLKIAGQAAQGDIKAADFLMRYGGYTPPVEQNITMRVPIIVDDLDDVEDLDDNDGTQ